jgi:hypothetical protein
MGLDGQRGLAPLDLALNSLNQIQRTLHPARPKPTQEIDNLVFTHHRLITPIGVTEGSRGLSETTPPDIVFVT